MFSNHLRVLSASAPWKHKTLTAPPPPFTSQEGAAAKREDQHRCE